MNGKLGITVGIIAIAGGWYLLSGNTAKAPASETTAATSGVAVTYTDQG